MAGIVSSGSCHLEKVARKVPDKSQVESRVKRYSRFVQNRELTAELFFLPFIEALLNALASSGVITVAMDGSETGRKCMTLMVSIIYRKRAIPLGWIVVKGSKGHLPETVHLELFEQVRAILSKECQIVFLGDGEFDGVQLQSAIINAGWEYVCRTAKNSIINNDDDEFSLSDVTLVPGEQIAFPNVLHTRKGVSHLVTSERLYKVTYARGLIVYGSEMNESRKPYEQAS